MLRSTLQISPYRALISTLMEDLFDSKEFERWILQARDTLESANEDLNNGRYNWACFKAQQAAEYAVKGLIYGLGSIPIGHSVLRLLARLRRRGVEVEGVMRYARILDRHRIPTRYPNAHPEGHRTSITMS
jgi:HEPN domain-containing protein